MQIPIVGKSEAEVEGLCLVWSSGTLNGRVWPHPHLEIRIFYLLSRINLMNNTLNIKVSVVQTMNNIIIPNYLRL